MGYATNLFINFRILGSPPTIIIRGIEIDASGHAMGCLCGVINQCAMIPFGQPFIYNKGLNYPTYEKELYALVQSVQK